MTVRFGPDEGTDWPEYPARAPRPPEPDWDPDTDTAWTQPIEGTVGEPSDWDEPVAAPAVRRIEPGWPAGT